MKIQPAVKTDYNQIHRCLEDAFGQAGGFANSHVWSPGFIRYENILVIRERGAIVALIGIFPMTLRLGRARLTVGGIGGVATVYLYRGKGYMSGLMQAAVKEMTGRGYPLSILWGNRHRYGHFGYENGGQIRELSLGSIALEKMGVPEIAGHWFHGKPAVRQQMWSVYGALPFRKERREREFAFMLSKSRGKVIYGGAGNRFAYVVLAGSTGEGQLREQAGDPRTILGILRGQARQYGYREFKLAVPDTADLPAPWLDAALIWRIVPAGMIKILDLRATLAAYRDELDAAMDRDGSLTLGLAGQPPVWVRKQNGKLEILPGDTRQAIVLSDQDVVKLVFGTFAWRPPGINPEQVRLLKAIFPLKFCIPPLDHV